MGLKPHLNQVSIYVLWLFMRLFLMRRFYAVAAQFRKAKSMGKSFFAVRMRMKLVKEVNFQFFGEIMSIREAR